MLLYDMVLTDDLRHIFKFTELFSKLENIKIIFHSLFSIIIIDKRVLTNFMFQTYKLHIDKSFNCHHKNLKLFFNSNLYIYISFISPSKATYYYITCVART